MLCSASSPPGSLFLTLGLWQDSLTLRAPPVSEAPLSRIPCLFCCPRCLPYQESIPHHRLPNPSHHIPLHPPTHPPTHSSAMADTQQQQAPHDPEDLVQRAEHALATLQPELAVK